MSLLTKVTLPNGALFNESQTFLGAESLFTTGTVFFVNSVTGSNDNAGTDPAAPKATVQGAISACTASKGDKIVVMVGHAETVTSTSINLSKAGVTVICLGAGTNRPTFTYGAAAATITVSAANCAWMGGYMVANFADVAAAFTVGAATNFQLLQNSFVDTSSILNFLSVLVTGSTNNAADGLTVVGNEWYGLAATSNAFVSILGNATHVYLADNQVNKVATNDAGHFVTLSSKVVLNFRCLRNFLRVTGVTSAAAGIFLTGSATTCNGIVAYNLIDSLDVTSPIIATTGTKLSFFENYYPAAADKSGSILPAIS
jgi:hypothetical protein